MFDLMDWSGRAPVRVAFGRARGGSGGIQSLAAQAGTDSVKIMTGVGEPLTLPAVTAMAAGVMTAEDKTRLDALNSTQFNSRAEMVVTDISDTAVQFVRTAGFAAPGDGGHALYHRAGSEPPHAGKLQSTDGSWWEIVPDQVGVSVKAFGAVGDGATDDASAIQDAIDFVMRGDKGGAVVFPFASGEAYAIASTLSIDGNRVGTFTNMVWLKGTGMPDRAVGGAVEKNMIKWIGFAGGTMLELVNPLDHRISDLCFFADNLAGECVHQTNANGGWGGVRWDNCTFVDSTENMFRYTGAVDGGRNVMSFCTFRKARPVVSSIDKEALVHYAGANNVNDQYVDCAFLHSAGVYYGAGVYVSSGSPDIIIRGGFMKTETNLWQSDGNGAAYFSANNVYVEGSNFYRSDKQVAKAQDFVNVRHAGGGIFIQTPGNNTGWPMNVTGGFSNGDIIVTGRDDFPLSLHQFDLRSGTISLDNSIGPRTNLIEIGRVENVAKTHSYIAAAGFITRIPNPDTDVNLNVNLETGGIAYSSRTGGQSVTVKNPVNATAIEDDGALLTILLHADGVSPVTVNWESAYRFAGGAAPTSVAGNSCTILWFLNIAGVFYETSRSENIA